MQMALPLGPEGERLDHTGFYFEFYEAPPLCIPTVTTVLPYGPTNSGQWLALLHPQPLSPFIRLTPGNVMGEIHLSVASFALPGDLLGGAFSPSVHLWGNVC